MWVSTVATIVIHCLRQTKAKKSDFFYLEVVALWGKIDRRDWILGGLIVRPSLRDWSY